MNKVLAGVTLGLVVAAGTAYQFVFKAPEVVKVEVSVGKNQQYYKADIVMTPQEAKSFIASGEDVVVIDVRRITDFMGKGHIPGAQQVWRPDISADDDQYPFGGMRATRDKMEELLGSLGVTPETTIVPYDAKGNYDAARLWWLLDMYGHSKVKMIDGGYQGWAAAGFEMVHSESAKREPTEYKFPWKENDYRLASLDDVQRALETGDAIILDTRSIKEFTGESMKSGAFRAGRIPHSVFVEYKKALDAGKNFKTVAELKAIYEKAGITADKPIIAYCQSAVRSAHTTFVLTQLLGYQNVKNYDGSWIEWSYTSEPLETGDAVQMVGL
ncbi:sulfurtransferase [Sansalvadorimonas sp. 2012CJ34-2]|uniref:Sulfurtransferase n=1 Tax=Parendozoicomonas callyspongiae TaxID=2942213 RepID=A0ABT0PII9_9GAMM|nr:sulfurtransferase [Sansalvadorimonas sp. 2012CJ34-2]MCL6270298.1 sulfurtransferase [Sansalvadorimonas sp. 2012CJ34-2]